MSLHSITGCTSLVRNPDILLAGLVLIQHAMCKADRAEPPVLGRCFNQVGLLIASVESLMLPTYFASFCM